MGKKNKYRWLIIIIIITLILGSIFASVYIKFYYKPHEKIDISWCQDSTYSGIGEIYDTLNRTNETISDINSQDVIFIFIFSFIIACIIALIGTAIYERILIHYKPIIKVKATLKSKEICAIVQNSKTGPISSTYVYYLTFKKENGEEITFTVSPDNYATILEGNKGTLEYKEGLHYRFINFHIEKFGD